MSSPSSGSSSGFARRLRALRLPVLILVLAAGGYGAWRYAFPEAPPAPPPTVAVHRADLEDTVLANGTLEAVNMVSVGAQVSGQVKTLAVDVGDKVKAGDLIAEIDSLNQQTICAMPKPRSPMSAPSIAPNRLR